MPYDENPFEEDYYDEVEEDAQLFDSFERDAAREERENEQEDPLVQEYRTAREQRGPYYSMEAEDYFESLKIRQQISEMRAQLNEFGVCEKRSRDPETGEIVSVELSGKKAEKELRKMRIEAERLEGYAWSDRSHKEWSPQWIAAKIINTIKHIIDPIYRKDKLPYNSMENKLRYYREAAMNGKPMVRNDLPKHEHPKAKEQDDHTNEEQKGQATPDKTQEAAKKDEMIEVLKKEPEKIRDIPEAEVTKERAAAALNGFMEKDKNAHDPIAFVKRNYILLKGLDIESQKAMVIPLLETKPGALQFVDPAAIDEKISKDFVAFVNDKAKEDEDYDATVIFDRAIRAASKIPAMQVFNDHIRNDIANSFKIDPKYIEITMDPTKIKDIPVNELNGRLVSAAFNAFYQKDREEAKETGETLNHWRSEVKHIKEYPQLMVGLDEKSQRKYLIPLLMSRPDALQYISASAIDDKTLEKFQTFLEKRQKENAHKAEITVNKIIAASQTIPALQKVVNAIEDPVHAEGHSAPEQTQPASPQQAALSQDYEQPQVSDEYRQYMEETYGGYDNTVDQPAGAPIDTQVQDAAVKDWREVTGMETALNRAMQYDQYLNPNDPNEQILRNAAITANPQVFESMAREIPGSITLEDALTAVSNDIEQYAFVQKDAPWINQFNEQITDRVFETAESQRYGQDINIILQNNLNVGYDKSPQDVADLRETLIKDLDTRYETNIGSQDAKTWESLPGMSEAIAKVMAKEDGTQFFIDDETKRSVILKEEPSLFKEYAENFPESITLEEALTGVSYDISNLELLPENWEHVDEFNERIGTAVIESANRESQETCRDFVEVLDEKLAVRDADSEEITEFKESLSSVVNQILEYNERDYEVIVGGE